MATLERAPLATIAVLLFAVGLNGCAWVSQQDFEDKVACLDEDHDGFVARTTCPDPALMPPGGDADCDETRADRNPAQDELGTPSMWYDGIDQDCDGEDVIDQDGDTYPGILESEWTPDHANLTWPTDLNSELDCDDLEPTTYPGSLAEAPYDGVDSNCDGEDDWDFDQDDHVPPPACLPLGAVAYTGTLPQDDCDDTNDKVHPGTDVADTWYDGIDQDCAGNNDFDKDGDTYIEDVRIAAYNLYVQQCGETDNRTVGDDCDDNPDDDGGQPVGAAAINPGATETWYDGVDQDCAADNDYDKDHDTYECDGSVISACSSHTGNDCVDDNADIHPNAVEKVGDAVDQDCDTLADAAPFHFSSYVWDQPRWPVVDATDYHYLLGVTADLFTEGAVELPNYGIVFSFAPAAANASGVVSARNPFEGHRGAAYPLGYGLALRGESDRFFAGTSTFRSAGTVTILRINRGDLSGPGSNIYDTNYSEYFGPNTGGDVEHQDFDVLLDEDDQYWFASCGVDAVQFLTVVEDYPDLVKVDEQWQGASEANYTGCFLESQSASEAWLYAYNTTGLTIYKLLLNTTADDDATIETYCTPATEPCASHPSKDYGIVYDVNQRDGKLVFVAANGVTVWASSDTSSNKYGPYLGTEDVLSADAWQKDDGTLYVAAVVADVDGGDADALNDVVLLYGNPSAPTATLNPTTHAEVVPRILPYKHPTMDPQPEPDGVSIFVDDNKVFIAVTGLEQEGEDTGDSVGWVFLGYP